MTWSYSGNPAKSDLDAVRFTCGDTNDDERFIQDEEISYLLTREGSVEGAAIEACEAIARTFLNKTDVTVGRISVKGSEISKRFSDCADRLRNQLGIFASMKVGGVNKSESEALDENTGLIQPSFQYGIDDHLDVAFERDADISHGLDRLGRC